MNYFEVTGLSLMVVAGLGALLVMAALWNLIKGDSSLPKKVYVITVDHWNGTYSRMSVVDVYTSEERAKEYCRRMNKGNTSTYLPVYAYETCELDEGR